MACHNRTSSVIILFGLQQHQQSARSVVHGLLLARNSLVIAYINLYCNGQSIITDEESALTQIPIQILFHCEEPKLTPSAELEVLIEMEIIQIEIQCMAHWWSKVRSRKLNRTTLLENFPKHVFWQYMSVKSSTCVYSLSKKCGANDLDSNHNFQ